MVFYELYTINLRELVFRDKDSFNLAGLTVTVSRI
jgi:hypothetical protein